VRHRRRSLLARRKELLRLAHFRALQQADLLRELVQRRCDHGERAEIFRVPVPLNDLGGCRRRLQSELFADILFHGRIDEGKGPDRAGDLSATDPLFRALKPLPVAAHLVVPDGELQSEGDGFGVDPVAPPDHEGPPVFHRPALERFQRAVQVLQQQLRRLFQQDGKGRIQDVRRRQPHVDEASVFPDPLRHGGQEGDDVVFGRLFDLVDPRGIEAGLFLDVPEGGRRDLSQAGEGLACEDFDVEPRLIAVFLAPNGGHLFTGVSGNQCGLSFLVGCAPRNLL